MLVKGGKLYGGTDQKQIIEFDLKTLNETHNFETKESVTHMLDIQDSDVILVLQSECYIQALDISNSQIIEDSTKQLSEFSIIYSLYKTNEPNTYAYLTSDQGVKFLTYDPHTSKSEIEILESVLYDKQNITCISEYFDGFYLVGIQDLNSLMVIDKETGVISNHLVSPYDDTNFLGIIKLPNYDLQDYPYLLAFQKSSIGIVNMQQMAVGKLCDFSC